MTEEPVPQPLYAADDAEDVQVGPTLIESLEGNGISAGDIKKLRA